MTTATFPNRFMKIKKVRKFLDDAICVLGEVAKLAKLIYDIYQIVAQR